MTTLAWDVARSVGQVLRFEGEVVVDWEPTHGRGYDHSFCLVFRAERTMRPRQIDRTCVPTMRGASAHD